MPTNPAPTQNFYSSGLRQKVDQLMDILYAGGVNNPATSIEQISYLLFLRLLTEKDDQFATVGGRNYTRVFSGKWSRYAWGNFVTLTGDQLFDSVRPAVESFHELPGLSKTGQLLFSRATLKIYDRPTLRAVIQLIDQLDLAPRDGVDLKGDMYEYLLSRLGQSGTNGQFRTSRHIIDMIVAMVNPQPTDRICDPACGTAGFLISAHAHILRQHTKPADLAKGRVDGSRLSPKQFAFLEEHAFTGYDNDADMVKIAIMNLYLHRLEKAQIIHHNPLTTPLPGSQGSYPGITFEVILANPPFAGSIQKESILADINIPTRDTELLFLKWFIDHLAPTGRAGVIVPAGVLFGSTKGAKKVRELLLTECELQAVVAMPSGVFKPYSGVSTAALIFQKRPHKIELAEISNLRSPISNSVWFYDMTADGFSLDDKRNPTDVNDIPDILARWPKREEGPNAYRVPLAKIIENDCSLAVGRYKTMTVEAVNHDNPATILREVTKLEEQIAFQAKALLAEVSK